MRRIAVSRDSKYPDWLPRQTCYRFTVSHLALDFKPHFPFGFEAHLFIVLSQRLTIRLAFRLLAGIVDAEYDLMKYVVNVASGAYCQARQ